MDSASAAIITTVRRAHGWLSSRPVLLDALVALLLAVLSLAELWGEGVSDRAREPDAIGVGIVLLGAVALLGRRHAPLPVAVGVVGLSCVFYALDYGSYMAPVGLGALYSLVAHEPNRRRAWTAIAVLWTALFVVACLTLLRGTNGIEWSNALSMTLSIGATLLAGAVIRNKEEIFVDTRQRAERAEAEKRLDAERAVTRERLRIAREMHDVVAHGMSLITVQAAAAQAIAETRPEDATRLMRSIEATGHDALVEMRRMLGVLRNGEASQDPGERGSLAPQPSLDDIGSVVAHCVDAGRPTELVIEGERRPLAPGVELAAFRIVQEALTNVVKHAGPSATATVTIRYGTDSLTVSVADTGRGAAAGPAGGTGGHGLVGMRERVEIYDGQLAAGPQPGGGYLVRASLPIGPPSLRDPEPGADRSGAGSAEPEHEVKR